MGYATSTAISLVAGLFGAVLGFPIAVSLVLILLAFGATHFFLPASSISESTSKSGLIEDEQRKAKRKEDKKKKRVEQGKQKETQAIQAKEQKKGAKQATQQQSDDENEETEENDEDEEGTSKPAAAAAAAAAAPLSKSALKRKKQLEKQKRAEEEARRAEEEAKKKAEEEAEAKKKAEAAEKKAKKKAAKAASGDKEHAAPVQPAAQPATGKKGANAAAPAPASPPTTAAKAPAADGKKEKAASKSSASSAAAAAAAAAAAQAKKDDDAGWEIIHTDSHKKSTGGGGSSSGSHSNHNNTSAKSSSQKKVNSSAVESSPSEEESIGSSDTTVEFTVDQKSISFIIGAKGATFQTLQSATGTRIEIPKGTNKVVITGASAEQVDDCRRAIDSLVRLGYSSLTHPGFVHDDVVIDSKHYGLIIGPKGATLNKLQTRTNTRITLPDKDAKSQKILIIGSKENVKLARSALKELATDGFSAFTHEGMCKQEIEFPREQIALLIGPKGQTIKSIQGNTKTRINIPSIGTNDNVVVVGTPEGVAKAAKEIANLLLPKENQVELDENETDYEPGGAWAPSGQVTEDALWD